MGKCNIIRSNLVGESINAQKLDEYSAWQIAGLLSRPIGSWYLSSESASPALLFGGTWEQLKDRFLVGAGNLYAVGTTGGEATHTLTIAEIPSHTHTQGGGNWNYATGGTAVGHNFQGEETTPTGSTGGGTPFNELPPYIATYMWHRVA